MPTVYVPHRDLHMFYLINPQAEVTFASCSNDPIPPCLELDPRKPNIIFLHAATSSSASFSAQLRDPRLANAFNLIAFDARCHGRTEGKERPDHSVAASSTCLLAAIDALGLKKYSVFGESILGVNEAVTIAAQRPEAVQALALASPGYRAEPEHILETMKEIEALMTRNKNGDGDQSGRLDDDALEAISRYFFGDDERLASRKERYKQALQLRYGLNKNAHDIRHIINFSMRAPIGDDVLNQINCPVLILQGSEDRVVSPENAARDWQRAFGSEADLRVIQGAPHLLSFTDFNIVNRMLAQFVTRSVRGHL